MDMSQLRFNPATGNFESLAPPSLPRYSNSSAASTAGAQSYAAPRRSVNDIIGGIGNAIADFHDSARPILTQILTWVLWIAGVGGLVAIALSGHWIMAIVLGAVAGYLYVGITALLAIVAVWVLFLPIAVLRFIFTNLFTLILAIVVIGGAVVYATNNSETAAPQAHGIEDVVMPVYYRCTASVLNVRSNPWASAPVVGALTEGDVVEVEDYFYAGEFAKIKYRGGTAYVARDYLEEE